MTRRALSPSTKYRNARARLTALEAEQARVARSRPRTSGTKSARTRALNRLDRQLRAARGVVTKTRRVVAEQNARRAKQATRTARKRSAARKRGWATRRKRAAAAKAIAPGKAMPWATVDGLRYIWPPSQGDRSQLGRFWAAYENLRDNTGSLRPSDFSRQTVFDEICGRHLEFLSDDDALLAHRDEYHFGTTLYRDRSEVLGLLMT